MKVLTDGFKSPIIKIKLDNVIVYVPMDPNKKGTSAEKTERAIRWVWSRGLYPTPTFINIRRYGKKSNNLSGADCKIRRKVFEELGIPLMRKFSKNTDRLFHRVG